MNRTLRTAGAALLAIVLAAGALLPNLTSAASYNPLEGRLGGTTKSFSSAYGDPDSAKSSGDINVYTVSGFGLVAAAFLNSNAYEITLAADRLSHKPLTDPDDADWTVTNAARFADAVVPTDATYDQPTKDKTKITLVGHSKALAKAFAQKNYDSLNVTGKPGDFVVVYNLDTAGNVFSIDASLGSGGSTSASRNSANAVSTKSSGSNSTNSGATVHCRDFTTQADAQAYFDSHGGDSNAATAGLDGDHDGKACETLP
jgi:hypothetical protein